MLDGAYNHSGTASSLGNFEPSLTRQHFFHKLIRHVCEEKALLPSMAFVKKSQAVH